MPAPEYRGIAKSLVRNLALSALLEFLPEALAMQEQDIVVLDDRSSGDTRAASGEHWRMFTDQVMGGVSEGRLTIDKVGGRPCLRMRGEVRLDNNGGFVQASLDVGKLVRQSPRPYTGLLLTVSGNGASYNIHLRTGATRLPWQSYRATFAAGPTWQSVRLPFTAFSPYRIETDFDPGDLRRIGLVAIGSEFSADLCLGHLALYRD
jgi:hypothetical protein